MNTQDQWLPLRELYDGFRTGWGDLHRPNRTSQYDYDPLLLSYGYDIIIKVDDGSYQGDSFILYRHGSLYGVLVFGWGSCSGCDALQACETCDEVEQLRVQLHDKIKWAAPAELLKWIAERDERNEWYTEDDNANLFFGLASTYLKEKVERPYDLR